MSIIELKLHFSNLNITDNRSRKTKIDKYVEKFHKLFQAKDAEERFGKAMERSISKGRRAEASDAIRELIRKYVHGVGSIDDLPKKYVTLKTCIAKTFVNDFYTRNLQPTRKALKFLISYLAEKKNLPNCKVIVCKQTRDLLGCLEKQLRKMKQGKKCLFFMPSGDNPHWTPIYLERTESGFRFLVTDSLAGKETLDPFAKLETKYVRGGPSRLAVRYIEEALKSHSLLDQAHILVHMGEARQTDGYSCPIFALKDMVKILKNPETYDWIEKNGQQNVPEPNQILYGNTHALCFRYLPPFLTTTTQSLAKIDEYVEQFPNATLFNKKSQQPESLRLAILRHQMVATLRNREGNLMRKEVNGKIARNLFKCDATLLSSLVLDAKMKRQRKPI